jgi:hypothetical protein
MHVDTNLTGTPEPSCPITYFLVSRFTPFKNVTSEWQTAVEMNTVSPELIK